MVSYWINRYSFKDQEKTATTAFAVDINLSNLFQSLLLCPRDDGQVGGRDNLLMTRISAPFSSLSRWLSAFKSDSCCGIQNDDQSTRILLRVMKLEIKQTGRAHEGPAYLTKIDKVKKKLKTYLFREAFLSN